MIYHAEAGSGPFSAVREAAAPDAPKPRLLDRVRATLPERSLYPDVWDVVGGHCEGGEAPGDALIREVEEEIGVTPRTFEEIAVLAEPHPAEHGEAQYHIFLVTAWAGGEPRLQGAEHSELRWVSLECASALPLAHPGYGELFSAALGQGDERKRDI